MVRDEREREDRSDACEWRGDCVAVGAGESSEGDEGLAVAVVAAEERRSSLAGRWMASLSS